MNRKEFDLSLMGMSVDIKEFQNKSNGWIRGNGFQRMNLMKEQIGDLLKWIEDDLRI